MSHSSLYKEGVKQKRAWFEEVKQSSIYKVQYKAVELHDSG